MKKLLAMFVTLALLLTASSVALAEFTLAQDPDDYKILVYWPAPDVYFEENIQPGYSAIEEEYGVTVDFIVGTEWTQDVENQNCEAAIAQGYKLFLVYGADTSGANALYQEMIDAGCEVVNYGGTVSDPQVAPVTVCGDVKAYSYDATIQMCEAMGGEGKIINVLENLGDVNTLQRQEGVEEAVALYPNVEICQTIGDINTRDEGYEKVADALAANPDASSPPAALLPAVWPTLWSTTMQPIRMPPISSPSQPTRPKKCSTALQMARWILVLPRMAMARATSACSPCSTWRMAGSRKNMAYISRQDMFSLPRITSRPLMMRSRHSASRSAKTSKQYIL